MTATTFSGNYPIERRAAWHVAQESVLNTQRHWLDCLDAGVEPQTSGADNLKTYALAEAAYESAATGMAVPPPA